MLIMFEVFNVELLQLIQQYFSDTEQLSHNLWDFHVSYLMHMSYSSPMSFSLLATQQQSFCEGLVGTAFKVKTNTTCKSN